MISNNFIHLSLPPDDFYTFQKPVWSVWGPLIWAQVNPARYKAADLRPDTFEKTTDAYMCRGSDGGG
jgi:hypothetical protein